MLKFALLPLLACFLAGQVNAAPANGQAKMDAFVSKLLSKMTLEEKVGQLGLSTGDMSKTGPGAIAEYREQVKKGQVGALLNVYGTAVTRELQELALQNSRLKIPLLFGLDVVNGYRTVFPIPLAEASSWNMALIERSARIAGTEAAADGIHWTYAPMVDIARDPRWGRVSEGAGEDPMLGSLVAAARVRGFQGSDLSSTDAVLACVKHFAAYGAALGGRDYNSVDMSQRELLETYLPPYHAAVKAGVASIMTSFNTISGVPSTSNDWLLTKTLRESWGFKGFVVTDYSAIAELVNHGVAANERDASELAIKAGTEMDMTSNDFGRYLTDLVRTKRVNIKLVDKAVRHVLEAKYKKGLFFDPFRFTDETRSKAALLAPAHIAHAREIARHSIVLLKNKGGLLPLKPNTTVALIGPLAEVSHGYWSTGITLRKGMEERAAEAGITLLEAKGAELLRQDGKDSSPAGQKLLAEAVRVASQADIVVLSLGEPEGWSGEAASRTRIRIPVNQQPLLEAVAAQGKPIVLVLSNGRPLALERENELAGAIVETWYLGTEAGHAIADVLFGDYNPSGKLTMTFPIDEGQIPIFYSELNTGRPMDPNDSYSSRYLDTPNAPLFPFGWGLSYTTFEYSGLRLSSRQMHSDGTLKVRVKVTNTGTVAGEETAQLYVRQMVAPVSRPLKLLRGFTKLFLQPGESREIEMPLRLMDLKFYDQNLRWTWRAGKFQVMVGGNSSELNETEFNLIQ